MAVQIERQCRVSERWLYYPPPVGNFPYRFVVPHSIPESWSRLGDRSTGAVHCFVSDWRLESTWRRLGDPPAAFCTEPDFSLPWDCSTVVAAYQLYRARYVGQAWAEQGAIVLPVLSWSQRWARPAVGLAPGSWAAVRAPGYGVESLNRWVQGFDQGVRPVRLGGLVVFGCGSRVCEHLRDLPYPVVYRALRGS